MTTYDHRSATPTRLTPAEVQSISFRRATFGRRGLDEGQVRAFLAEVEQELVTVLNEKAALAEEVARLRGGGAPGGAPGASGALVPVSEDAHIQAVRMLSRAQRTADEYVADAERYSRELAEDAHRNRDDILADAKNRAVHVLEGARGQAPAPASGHPSPSLPPDERQELEREIAYLRSLAETYRDNLRAYLDAMARNVDAWEQAERDRTGAPPAPPPSRPYEGG